MSSPAATAAAWWGVVRAAGWGRLAYEGTLAAALSGVTAGLSLTVGAPPPVAVAGLAVADLALVGLRRRFPATVVIVAAALGAVFSRADPALLFGLAFSAGYRIGGPWRLTVVLAAALTCQIGGSWARAGTMPVPQVLLTAGVFVAVIVFPATLARLSAQRRRILTLMHEGITNALRHARGGAVEAAIRYEEGALIAEVVNGPGDPHDGHTSGQGLYGLAERVRIAGGVLYHGTEPDGGFRLAVAQGTVSRSTYDQLRIGDAAVAVRDKLPDRSAELDPHGVVPPAPPGSECVAYRAAPSLRSRPGDEGYRFCFRDGTLISKEALADVG